MKSAWQNVLKVTGKVVLWTAGVILGLMIILEIVLSGTFLTRMVEKVAADFVDGDVSFGKASVSMFRRFPAAVLTLEDFSVTYPAERFDSLESAGVQGHLMYKGTAEVADTLASFSRFAVGVNIPALISGTVHIPYMRLDKPRVFAHSYADGSANWNIFKTGSEEEEADTTESEGGLPKIVIGRVMMTGRPHVVYTDSRDTVFAMVTMKRLMLNGKINSKRLNKSNIGLTLDSMFVAGRLGRDTLALGLDKLYLHEKDKALGIEAAAKAFLATNSFGRVRVPVEINGLVTFPKDSIPAISTEELQINIMNVPLSADADLRFRKDFTAIKADARIPHTTLTHPDFPEQELSLSLGANAATDSRGRINVDLRKLEAAIKGASVSLKGNVRDVTGNDPAISIDGRLNAAIDLLARFIPDSLGIAASGALSATIGGQARLSQLNIYNFSRSSLLGEVRADSITVNMPADSINADIDGLRIVLGPEDKVSRRDSSKSFRLMGITGEIAKADLSYKDAMKLKMSDFRIAAKNIVDGTATGDTTRRIYPFGGSVSAGRLSFRDSEGTSIRVENTRNGFQVLPKKGQPQVPLLTFNSRNKRISMRSGFNRALITDADISASAAMNTVERRKKMRAMRDSLARVYPDVPKDSLFRHMMAQKGPRPAMPEWMKEEDFRKSDIDISLDKTLAKYFRDWDLKGGISVKTGMVMTPYFPVRNILQGFDLKFTNDRIAIGQLAIRSGDSDLSATGELTGLKRALLGRRGSLKLDVDITSQGMNANQLLAAYTTGMNFNPESLKGQEELSDEEFEKQVVLDTAAAVATPSLIVVPANLNADIRLNASDITYSDLHIKKMTADLIMKERCVQITDTKALTNMGDITLEGFYATQSKKDLKTGFSINFKDITAEKVINLMPAVDTLMPLLKSFGGLLNCELAATARLDTNMNLVMPSINGIMRIGGDDLTIKNNEMFRKLAKLLIFKNKKEGRINKMTVEGVIKDSKVEVFPFILEMDRYMLGLSGVQNMDMSFRYHASLIKSPFLIKLGMDIYGPDFDHMKFKIGKAKYKNRNVPVFSTVIDNTKINLVESIRNIFDKGVTAAIIENENMGAIEEHKKEIGYVQAVDQKMEELSADEQKQLEAQQQAEGPAEEQAEQQTE